MNKSLYEILGIENSATPEEIRMAYKRLVAKHHPDKGGDAEVFAEIEGAYRVLKDAVNRTHYDETGENSLPKEKQMGRDRLAALFGIAIQKLITSPNSPYVSEGFGFEIKKVLGFVEKELDSAIDTSNRELGVHQQKVQKLISYKNKIQTNNGTVNLFEGVINQGMDEAKSNIRMLEFRVLVDQSSLDMLDDYVCTLEAEQIEEPRRYMNYLGTGGML